MTTSESKEIVLSSPGLVVRKSRVPGAGLGLYATKSFSKGTIVCCYTGKEYRTKEAIRLEDKSYLMRLGPQTYVDAKDDQTIAARYINDCRNKRLYNVVFNKLETEKRADVIALRDIEEDEELFVDYGKWYWLFKSPSKLET